MRRRTHRVSTGTLGILAVVLLTGCTMTTSDGNLAPSAPHAVFRPNPVPADDASLATGGALFQRDCAGCHTVEERPAEGAEITLRAADLAAQSVQEQSDGLLFWKILHGHDAVPSYEPQLTNEQAWHVVNYVRTLGCLAPSFPQYSVPEHYRRALTSVIQPYLEMGRSLASDDRERAYDLERTMLQAALSLSAIPSAGLPPETRLAWQSMRSRVQAAVNAVIDDHELAPLRMDYRSLSRELASAVGTFGHTVAAPLREYYCVLSLPTTGAIWLQLERLPRNPYLGRSNPHCGRLIHVFGGERPWSGGGGVGVTTRGGR